MQKGAWIMKNAAKPIPVPLLAVIAYWEGDKPQVAELLRILAGLQQNHAGNEVHLMLVNRKDCTADPNFVKIVSPKFNIHTHTNTSTSLISLGVPSSTYPWA